MFYYTLECNALYLKGKYDPEVLSIEVVIFSIL